MAEGWQTGLGEPCAISAEHGTGLADLLAWDLRLGCEAPAAFRVFYRWDGRTFSRVMAERPGATVPVRVRVR